MLEQDALSPVMPDFNDAAGLEALTAAGGRSVSASRSHGDGKSGAPSPAASVAWPPPETPEPFKALVRQVDAAGATITALWVPGVAPLPEKVCDQTADGLWPLAYYYGAGGEKPTPAVLWTYAAVALLGVVIMHVAQAKAAADAKPPEAAHS